MVVTCEVCQADRSVYKCATCGIKYCKVACYKLHKEKTCEVQNQPDASLSSVAQFSQPTSVTYTYPTEDTVPVEQLALLKNDEYLNQCLENPHLRQILISLVNNPNPKSAMQSAMQEPIFLELADACLKVVDTSSNLPYMAIPCGERHGDNEMCILVQ
nr:EOG090X0JQ4 [Lepidurus arcticus]